MGHEDIVKHAVFSADGESIVTASWDKTVRSWAMATGNTLHQLKGHESEVNHAAFSPDGKTIVTTTGCHVAATRQGNGMGGWLLLAGALLLGHCARRTRERPHRKKALKKS